jgi:toxin ParE1/3/4
MPKYHLSSQADIDLTEIVDFIAKDNIDAALAVDARFTDMFEMLGQSPKIGKERADLEYGLRSFPVDSYVVFYRGWSNDVLIVRVLHAARDIDELFS